MLIDLEFITYVYGYRILFDYEDRIRLWYILFLKIDLMDIICSTEEKNEENRNFEKVNQKIDDNISINVNNHYLYDF